jgi:hypothetical protein
MSLFSQARDGCAYDQAFSDRSRTVVESGELPLCGQYSVEEEADDEDRPDAVIRRLVFLRNQHVIQSEVGTSAINLIPGRCLWGNDARKSHLLM